MTKELIDAREPASHLTHLENMLRAMNVPLLSQHINNLGFSGICELEEAKAKEILCQKL